MTVLPADNTRKSSVTEVLLSDQRNQLDDTSNAVSQFGRLLEPLCYGAKKTNCQGDGATGPSAIVGVAVVQGAVFLTNQCLSYLRGGGIEVVLVASPEAILKRLHRSVEGIDILLCPIWTLWQPSLDFAREVRRIRERHGAPPHPRTLILSFTEHLPTTVNWFRRTNGTTYSLFTSKENLVQALWAMQKEIMAAWRAFRLHLRFVHSGNSLGIGCIPGEEIAAAYGCFTPGYEGQITTSASILRFLNFMAKNRWQFRSTHQLSELMACDPLYQGKAGRSLVPGTSSLKMYIARAEEALLQLWRSL